MRRTERYTVPLPEPWYPDEAFYRLRFREKPWWYRAYLRARALFAGIELSDVTRRHHLQEIRRRLQRDAREIVDTSIPALIHGFFRPVSHLQRELGRIMPAIDDAIGTARNRFLLELLAARAPNLAAHLQTASSIPAALLDDPSLPLDEYRAIVRANLEAALTATFDETERAIAPVWHALQTLRILGTVDIESIQPISGSDQARTPLRIVAPVIGRLHQCIEAAFRHASSEATELAVRHYRSRGRLRAVSAAAVWQSVEDVRRTVPLLDLARFAAGEPFLGLPDLSLKSDWRPAFERALAERAVGLVGPTVVEERTVRVRRILSESFLVDRQSPGWLPDALYPRTTATLMVMAASESFRNTRRAVTQLVIDGQFNHLDTRNSLHQAALQLDQALERIATLLGDDARTGTLTEEIGRLSRRAGGSSLVRRQLMGLYERYRPRIRSIIEEACGSLIDGGSLVSRTVNGREGSFELDRRAARTDTGGLPLEEQLQLVADHWARLGRELEGLYRAEAEVTVQRIPLVGAAGTVDGN